MDDDDFLYPRVRQIAVDADALKKFLETQTGIVLPADTHVYNVRVTDWSRNGHVHFFVTSEEFPRPVQSVLRLHTVPFLGKKVPLNLPWLNPPPFDE